MIVVVVHESVLWCVSAGGSCGHSCENFSFAVRAFDDVECDVVFYVPIDFSQWLLEDRTDSTR